LTTDLVDCDINPTYVRFSVKDKITQLRLPEEIEVDKSKVQRSTTTGAIMVTCPTVYKRPKNTKEYKQEREEFKKKMVVDKLQKEMKEKKYAIEKPMEENKEDFISKTTKIATPEPYEPDFDLDELPDLD
jgi:hypothetical protein